jgi:hypothetical protein
MSPFPPRSCRLRRRFRYSVRCSYPRSDTVSHQLPRTVCALAHELVFLKIISINFRSSRITGTDTDLRGSPTQSAKSEPPFSFSNFLPPLRCVFDLSNHPHLQLTRSNPKQCSPAPSHFSTYKLQIPAFFPPRVPQSFQTEKFKPLSPQVRADLHPSHSAFPPPHYRSCRKHNSGTTPNTSPAPSPSSSLTNFQSRSSSPVPKPQRHFSKTERLPPVS